MIRRRLPDGFLLITHEQHAQIAAAISAKLGGVVQPPCHPKALHQALLLHNTGFAMLDAKPALNPSGLPLGHDEFPLPSLLDAWAAAADAAPDNTAKLLLSTLSLQRSSAIPTGPRSARERFLLNRHQQLELERQTALRTILGIRDELELSAPVVQTNLNESEQRFLYDYRLLLFVAQLAMDLCLGRDRPDGFPPIPTSPSGPPLVIHSTRQNDEAFSLSPFPLHKISSFNMIGRIVPNAPFDHELELHEFLKTTPQQTLHVRLQP